jgi:peptidoglycan/LPS O-acetylase OafA/YrhL
MGKGNTARRIPELDGIRGLAILLVLAWHYFALPLMQSPHRSLRAIARLGSLSWSGVDLFFVLSEF